MLSEADFYEQQSQGRCSSDRVSLLDFTSYSSTHVFYAIQTARHALLRKVFLLSSITSLRHVLSDINFPSRC